MSEPGMAPGPALIWCPFPGEASARLAATALLDEGLVACANIIPGMVSLFDWDGVREEAREVVMVLKTDAAVMAGAIDRLAELHPYEQPAILGWRCDAAPPATAAWLRALVR